MDTTVAGDLEGRKRVRLRMRRNLSFTAQESEGRTWSIVKDPVTLRYHRLEEKQRFVLEQMDGTRTLEDIRGAYEKRFRPERLPLEELEAFASQLLHGGLVENEAPQAGRLLFERGEKERREARWAAVLNFLFIRVPLCNPDRFLARLLPWTRFVFTIPFLLLSAAVVLAALGLVATHWGAFLARLPDSSEFFTLRNLLYLWATLGFVKVLHELGHGLCCKALGGTVHEMGILFLFFFPTLYCNVTDSWTMPSKWRRMAVGAAGVAVELFLAAVATFVWWGTEPGTLVHNLCLALMVVCTVNTLVFNANPLLRADGYYVLSDWLEMPNLAELSSRRLRVRLLHWLGVETRGAALAVPRWDGFLVGYAAVSFVYRWVVILWCFQVLQAFLDARKLGPLGSVVAVAGVAVLLGWPLCRLLGALHSRGRLPDMKPVRVWCAVGLVAAVALLVAVVPFPVHVRGAALVQVEPDQMQKVVVPESGGFLKAILVKDGQRVRAGDVLATLANPQLEIQLRVNEADQGLRALQKSAQLAELAADGAVDAQAIAGLQQTEAELKALLHQHALLLEQRDRLTLRAPCDGTVMGLSRAEDRGKWLERGTELCRVGDDRTLRAVFLAEPADRELIQPGARATIRIHGGASHHWPGAVTEVSQVDSASIPPQLSSRAGGEVATRQDPASRVEKPFQPHYLVAVRFQRSDGLIHPGVMGRVKVEVGSQTLWWRFRRYLATTFHWGN